MKEKWYCIDLFALFEAKVEGDNDYAYCTFGCIEKDDDYYDFGTTGMPRLCCDGEQCKLIKKKDGVLTFLSDGNSYEDKVEDYYFKLTEEEAEIAGIQLDEENFYGCDKCQKRFEWEHIEWVNGSCGFCSRCYNTWFLKLPSEEQERIIDGGDF